MPASTRFARFFRDGGHPELPAYTHAPTACPENVVPQRRDARFWIRGSRQEQAYRDVLVEHTWALEPPSYQPTVVAGPSSDRVTFTYRRHTPLPRMMTTTVDENAFGARSNIFLHMLDMHIDTCSVMSRMYINELWQFLPKLRQEALGLASLVGDNEIDKNFFGIMHAENHLRHIFPDLRPQLKWIVAEAHCLTGDFIAANNVLCDYVKLAPDDDEGWARLSLIKVLMGLHAGGTSLAQGVLFRSPEQTEATLALHLAMASQ